MCNPGCEIIKISIISLNEYNIAMYLIFILIISNEEFKKLKLNDLDVFKEIYNKYKKNIFNYILIKVNGNNHLAEEIFSDTIYSALKSAHSIRNKDKILNWFYRIAKRRFLDNLRKKYKIKEETFKEGIIIEKQTLDDKVIEQEKIVVLNAAHEKLKPIFKKALDLRYKNNKSQKEIALILNKTESSIESILVRARKALKEEIEKIYKDK